MRIVHLFDNYQKFCGIICAFLCTKKENRTTCEQSINILTKFVIYTLKKLGNC